MAGEEGLTGTPDTESLPTSRSETPPLAEEGASDTVAAGRRPLRAAVVNAGKIIIASLQTNTFKFNLFACLLLDFS